MDKRKSYRVWDKMPPDGVPVEVTGIDWLGWGPAFFGPAKTPSEPNEPYNTKRCWRHCNTEDEITNPPTDWRPLPTNTTEG